MKAPKLIAGTILMLAAGCAAPQQGNQASGAPPAPMRMPAPPVPPPAVPPSRRDPIDVQLSESARREIRAAFLAADPGVRANAVESAQQTLGADAHDIVAAGLDDKEPVVRFAATMAAGQLKLMDLQAVVLKLADDSDMKVRVGARFALHRMGDTHLSHELEKTARDPDARIREQTAMVLGHLGEKSALKILNAMANDPDADVRLQVAESTWRLADNPLLSDHELDGLPVLQVLVAGIVSKFADDQMVCLQAIAAAKDPRVQGYVRGKLTDPYGEVPLEVSLVAARSMGEMGSDEGYTIASRNTRSKDARQRFLSALALGAIGRSDAQSSLAPLLRDSEPRVRLAAATALLQLKAPS